MIRTYSELIKFPTFEERFNYLKLNGVIGEELFGHARYLNQVFYQGTKWRRTRRKIIIRDNGCDLGLGEEYRIYGIIHVHHLNPITIEQLLSDDPCLYDEENLISTSEKTHRAITIGDENLLERPIVIRRPNDMCPWKTQNSWLQT